MIFSGLDLKNVKKKGMYLENYFKNNIEQGIFPKNTKLPSTRELAEILSVSRNTCIKVYNLLSEQDYLRFEKGKGTYVSYIKKEDENIEKIDYEKYMSTEAKRLLTEDLVKKSESIKISFKSIGPRGQIFFTNEIKKSFLRKISMEEGRLFSYGNAWGYPALRTYFKKYMESKGVSMENREILITNGATEGISLICEALISEGDLVITESPTHDASLKIIRHFKGDIIGIDRNVDTLDLLLMEDIIKRLNPKFIFVIPSYHNPLGSVMTIENRMDFLKLVEKYKIPVVEDGFSEELIESYGHPSPLVGLSNSNLITYVGSFSKVLFPGLRIGWVCADKKLIESLVSLKRLRNLHTSYIDQSIMEDYLKQGDFKAYLKRVRSYYGEKKEFVELVLNEELKEAKILGNNGIYVFLKLEVNVEKLLKECKSEGLDFTLGSEFYPDKSKSYGTIRLGISHLGKDEIREGIRIIKECKDKLIK